VSTESEVRDYRKPPSHLNVANYGEEGNEWGRGLFTNTAGGSEHRHFSPGATCVKTDVLCHKSVHSHERDGCGAVATLPKREESFYRNDHYFSPVLLEHVMEGGGSRRFERAGMVRV